MRLIRLNGADGTVVCVSPKYLLDLSAVSGELEHAYVSLSGSGHYGASSIKVRDQLSEIADLILAILRT
jgi:hypothetical protein